MSVVRLERIEGLVLHIRDTDMLDGTPVLDLDYEEDSNAEADSNFVLTGAGDIVEIQATGEKRGFSRAEFESLFALASKGIAELVELQKVAVG